MFLTATSVQNLVIAEASDSACAQIHGSSPSESLAAAKVESSSILAEPSPRDASCSLDDWLRTLRVGLSMLEACLRSTFRLRSKEDAFLDDFVSRRS